jgi:sec-independent protein translocase protein TatC
MMIASIPIATGMFLTGMAFSYLLMLPAAVPFLRDFMFFRFAWRPSAYFDLVTSLMFWIGLVFEMPLAVYALALIGWVRARDLAQYWKFAVAGIAVLAAVITPTPDPVNMTIVMIPLFFLYGVSILVAFLGQKSAAGRQGASGSAKLPTHTAV